MTSPVKNQVYTAEILGYSSEGLGIARIGGQVVFVHDAIAGEVCDILVMKVLKKAAFGKVVAWKAVSPHRREPDCPYYRQCGGCTFRHMDYTEELRAKGQRVQDALTRLGGSSVAVEEVLGAAEPLHYRNKSQYPVSADGRVGFYRARTHQVTNLDACLIQMPQADAAAGALRTYLAEYRVPGYDEKNGTGLVRHLYVRTNAKGQSLICVVVNGEALPHEDALVSGLRRAVRSAVGVVLNSNTRRDNVILGDQYRTLWGEDTLTDTLCGHSFRLSIPSFYQVNRDQAEVLYRKAVEYAGLTGTELVLDLYCGAGTITLTMADKAKKVIGAEIISAAVENARENAADNGVENVEFFCGDAGDIALKLAGEDLHPDVICVDPPRKGLAPEVIDAMVRMGPQRIVYVSCDPATLGRDVKLLAQRGYQAVRAAAVDLFPGTAHVETVVLLSHKKPDGHINVKVEFGEGEGKVPLDNIAKRAEEYKPKERVTYKMIKEYIEAKYGFKVHTAYIAEVKRDLGLPMYDAPNAVEELKQPRKHPTAEKVEAIKDALKHFEVI